MRIDGIPPSSSLEDSVCALGLGPRDLRPFRTFSEFLSAKTIAAMACSSIESNTNLVRRDAGECMLTENLSRTCDRARNSLATVRFETTPSPFRNSQSGASCDRSESKMAARHLIGRRVAFEEKKWVNFHRAR